MEYPLAVQVRESISDLDQDRPGPFYRHGHVGFHERSKVAPFDVLGDEKRQPEIGRRTEVEDRQDVGMRDARQELGLATETRSARVCVFPSGIDMILTQTSRFRACCRAT